MKQAILKNLAAIAIGLLLVCLTSAYWTQSQLHEARNGAFCVTEKDDALAREPGREHVVRRQLARAVLQNHWPETMTGFNRAIRFRVTYGPGMIFTTTQKRAAYYDALPRCSVEAQTDA